MFIKCYNKTYNKALRDSNLKGLLTTTNCKELAMTTANNTRNIKNGQSHGAKLVYGVGYNSRREHKSWQGGTRSAAYAMWRNMIERCYSHQYQVKQPSYIGCNVSEEWHDFQDFADWYYKHPYSDLGYQLDKDILIPNNKTYSPRNCCLIPRELNSLDINKSAKSCNLPKGVDFHKNYSQYRVRIRINSKPVHLGYFGCLKEAHNVYKIAKEAYVKEKALEWQDRIADNVFQALMNWTLDS